MARPQDRPDPRRRGSAAPAVAVPGMPVPPVGLPWPLHCDWAWRPAAWDGALAHPALAAPESGAAVAPGVALHHNCVATGVRLVQEPGCGPASFGLRLSADEGAEGFVSLAIDLPPAAWAGLRPEHMLGLFLALPEPAAGALYARVNLRHGPNTATALRAIPPERQCPEGALVEIDLVGLRFNPRRVSHVWCDLILAGEGRAGQLEGRFSELAFTRRPRADF